MPPSAGMRLVPATTVGNLAGGASGSRTHLHGFAVRCITALLSRRAHLKTGSPGGLHAIVRRITWSGRRVSNSRPIPWQGIALPTELLPHEANAHYKGLGRPVNRASSAATHGGGVGSAPGTSANSSKAGWPAFSCLLSRNPAWSARQVPRAAHPRAQRLPAGRLSGKVASDENA